MNDRSQWVKDADTAACRSKPAGARPCFQTLQKVYSMIEESHIIKNGGKRIRHGSYKIVYRDYHVKNKKGVVRYDYRAEIQTITLGGVLRIRKWFKTPAEAWDWLGRERH